MSHKSYVKVPFYASKRYMCNNNVYVAAVHKTISRRTETRKETSRNRSLPSSTKKACSVGRAWVNEPTNEPLIPRAWPQSLLLNLQPHVPVPSNFIQKTNHFQIESSPRVEAKVGLGLTCR